MRTITVEFQSLAQIYDFFISTESKKAFNGDLSEQ